MAHIDRGSGPTVKLAISNYNDQPYFFQWLRDMPAKEDRPPNSTYIQKPGKDGAVRNYRISKAFAIYISSANIISREAFGEMQRFLYLHGADDQDTVAIEVGKIDGRYSMDIMRRLLNPDFDPSKELQLRPFRMTDSEGRLNIGLSALHPPDTRLLYSKDSAFLSGCPQPESTKFQGKTLWNFEPVAEWLFDQVQRKLSTISYQEPVLPRLQQLRPDERPSRAEPIREDDLKKIRSQILGARPADAPDFLSDDLPF